MSSFDERQKKLFNHLRSAEELCSFSKSVKATSQPNYGSIDKKTYKKVKHEMKQFRGRESIFKRPEANIRECLRSKCTPDYIKNPEKWKYYSLSDVTQEQMSDKTNIQTAIAFLREIEERDDNFSKNEVIDETGAVFKKPTFQVSKTIKDISKEEQQPNFKSNKVIMPEYVVGVSGKKVKNKLNISKQSKGVEIMKKPELKLNHLYDIDNEDDNI